jgi:hypothetical protein
MTEILRLVARLPFDVAADARLLFRRDRLARKHCIEGGPQIAPGNGNAVLGAAVVELTTIDQFPLLVEQEEIGRARRLIRFATPFS